jgi:hypothetical protein
MTVSRLRLFDQEILHHRSIHFAPGERVKSILENLSSAAAATRTPSRSNATAASW